MTYTEKCQLIEKAYGGFGTDHAVKLLFELLEAAFAIGVAEERQYIKEHAKYVPDVVNGGGHYLVCEAQFKPENKPESE
jgi:hypothetical protein